MAAQFLISRLLTLDFVSLQQSIVFLLVSPQYNCSTLVTGESSAGLGQKTVFDRRALRNRRTINAALLNYHKHLLKLALNSERDLCDKIAITAALICYLRHALCARTTLFFNVLAYQLLKLDTGSKFWASEDGDFQL